MVTYALCNDDDNNNNNKNDNNNNNNNNDDNNNIINNNNNGDISVMLISPRGSQRADISPKEGWYFSGKNC